MGLNMYLFGIRRSEIIDFKRKMLKAYDEILEVYGWRKSDWFHKWFVDNVQDGIDNCAYYYVSKNDLMNLRDACHQVLENPHLAKELLPGYKDFLYGKEKYDKYYFLDILHTLISLDELISDEKYKYFLYHSSW